MSNEFAGISRTECPVDCTPDCCAISGVNVCSHPMKGGLQGALQRDPEVVKRYQGARKILAHQQVEGGKADHAPAAARPAASKPKKPARKRKKARARAEKPAAAEARTEENAA